MCVYVYICFSLLCSLTFLDSNAPFLLLLFVRDCCVGQSPAALLHVCRSDVGSYQNEGSGLVEVISHPLPEYLTRKSPAFSAEALETWGKAQVSRGIVDKKSCMTSDTKP